ncbi:MAG TPA: permease prefix domain 1-containing protein [Acidobacteriaceae bacterium]|jgi:hypothetical protein|nr:permease prefix domain 1-containing protein [Acidobacteriaceae bacterium]
MGLGSRLKAVTANLLHRQRADADLDAELTAWIDTVTEERFAAGMRPEEARRTALAEFGGTEQVKTSPLIVWDALPESTAEAQRLPD